MTIAEADFLTATRTSYDALADAYADEHDRDLPHLELERAMITAFAELVRGDCRRNPDKPRDVADVGCGPGQVTAYLSRLGVSAFGVDLSPSMVAEARRRHPELEFRVGSMTSLDAPDGSLAGIAALFSIIYIPAAELPGVFAEFARALAAGGRLLLVFQTGDDEVRHLDSWLGRDVALRSYRRRAQDVIQMLVEAGFAITAHLARTPDGVMNANGSVIIARKPAASDSAA